MIRHEQRKQLHHYIIHDLAVKSLQQDYVSIEKLKMKAVYLPFFDQLLKEIRNETFKSKNLLQNQKIRVVSLTRIDEFFSDLLVTTAGNDEVFRYANQALKTQVEQLVHSYLKQLESHSK
ncbi:aconitate hydratase [Lysinibacillus fusiformis]|uniref:aconitate hydratase n=1 Tax=Lysinibacillus fusiformis TaxID=28031 RepID=UPI0018814E70|nr:aconitate hydratase [Lysinibacillus fusiformis]MBD8523826.1 aconitate hydratase [Lysinibacillus fusiformis]